MKTPRKTMSHAQPTKQVTVDAGLLPKSGKRGQLATDRPATAKINVVAPMHPAVTAMREKNKQQAIKSALMKVGAAIEEGEVPAPEAKRLILGRVVRRLGSVAAAEKWYRSHHLAELGGRTPAQLIRAGQLKALLEHIGTMTAMKT